VHISLVLGLLPSLVIVDDVLIDDSDLLINTELSRSMFIGDLSSNSGDLLHKCINLFELDQQDFVSHNTLNLVDKLLSRKNIQRNQINV
jgi:hypothetical protein